MHEMRSSRRQRKVTTRECHGRRRSLNDLYTALERLGASLADVVRTRMFVTDISRWEEYGLAHGAAFGETMPATSMIGIAALVDPRMLIEVEAVAYKPGAGR